MSSNLTSSAINVNRIRPNDLFSFGVADRVTVNAGDKESQELERLSAQ